MIPDYSKLTPSEREKKLKALHQQGLEYIEKAFENNKKLKEIYYSLRRENYWEFIDRYKKDPLGQSAIFLTFIMEMRANDRIRAKLGADNIFKPLNKSAKKVYEATSEEKRQILSDIMKEEERIKEAEENEQEINNQEANNQEAESQETESKEVENKEVENKEVENEEAENQNEDTQEKETKLKSIPLTQVSKEEENVEDEKIQDPRELLSDEEREQEDGMFAGLTESTQAQQHQTQKDASQFVNFEGKQPSKEQQTNNQTNNQEGRVYTEEQKEEFIEQFEKLKKIEKLEKEKNALGYEEYNPKIFTNPNLFEGITPLFDLEQIRTLKQKGFQMLIFGNLIFFVSTIICLISAVYLAVSRDTEVVAITFHEPSQSFVSMQRIDKNFYPREELKKSVISAYVYDRESINRFDEEKRQEMVKAQSTTSVWSQYYQLFHSSNSIYSIARDKQSEIYRKIQIIEVSLIDKEKTAFVTFRATLTQGLKTIYVKDYRATIVYAFEPQRGVKPEELRANPLGFKVHLYQLEAFRELQNPENVAPKKEDSLKAREESANGGFKKVFNQKDGVTKDYILPNAPKSKKANKGANDGNGANTEEKTPPLMEEPSLIGKTTKNTGDK